MQVLLEGEGGPRPCARGPCLAARSGLAMRPEENLRGANESGERADQGARESQAPLAVSTVRSILALSARLWPWPMLPLRASALRRSSRGTRDAFPVQQIDVAPVISGNRLGICTDRGFSFR
jgi:hypothetical protein